MNPVEIRNQFFRSLSPLSSFHLLFEHVPGLIFFAKDRQSRFMAANRNFYERFGVKDEAALIGKNDDDFFPPGLASHFREDDSAVMSTGQPKLNIVELFFNDSGTPDWFITNKMPLFDEGGIAVGVMGTTRSYETSKQVMQPYLSIDRAVELIRTGYRSKLTVQALAAHVNLSERQLQRKFVAAFGSSPQEFLMKVRVQAACNMLQHTDRSVGEIAEATGFPDSSAFIQHFRKHLGTTPLHYQKRFRLVKVKPEARGEPVRE